MLVETTPQSKDKEVPLLILVLNYSSSNETVFTKNFVAISQATDSFFRLTIELYQKPKSALPRSDLPTTEILLKLTQFPSLTVIFKIRAASFKFIFFNSATPGAILTNGSIYL